MTEIASVSPRLNNFDLIRLLASIQVAIVHAVDHLHLQLPWQHLTLPLLSSFPGVPIFFFISGFLIAKSYSRQSLLAYARNRALRIYPGLWVCLILSVTSIWASGYFQQNSPNLTDFALWVSSQITLGQFYNPDFLRGYGVGVINGSLWTISVELQFYAIVPILFLLYGKNSRFFWLALLSFAFANTIFEREFTIIFFSYR